MDEDLAAMRTYARALASRTRLRTLGELAAADELTVGELSRRLGVSQALMSWHLRRLRQAQLARARRQGRQVLYRLDRAGLGARHADLTRLIEAFTTPDASAPAGAPPSSARAIV